MAFIPVASTAEVAIVATLDGQELVNTLYFWESDGWTLAEMTQLGADIRAWLNTHYKNLAGVGVTFTELRIRDLTTQNAPGLTYVTGFPLAAVHNFPLMPNSVTVAASFLTALRGRNYRGRNYFIGLTETDVVGNMITTTKATEIANMYNALNDPAVITNGQWVVVSRYLNNAPRAAGLVTPITGVSVDRVIDSQRRRLPGRGA